MYIAKRSEKYQHSVSKLPRVNYFFFFFFFFFLILQANTCVKREGFSVVGFETTRGLQDGLQTTSSRAADLHFEGTMFQI